MKTVLLGIVTLWLGLLLSLFYFFTTPERAIFGAILGYGLLWIAASLFTLIRKKEGMGHGDFKMLGMLGAWFGAPGVLNILLIAILLGLLLNFFYLGTHLPLLRIFLQYSIALQSLSFVQIFPTCFMSDFGSQTP